MILVCIADLGSWWSMLQIVSVLKTPDPLGEGPQGHLFVMLSDHNVFMRHCDSGFISGCWENKLTKIV